MSLRTRNICIIAAAAVVVIAAVILCLFFFLRKGNSPLIEADPALSSFADGTTINGVDVSGLSAEEAAQTLADQITGYTFTLNLGDVSYTVSAEQLDMSYNDSKDLNALLELQGEDSTQISFSIDDLYLADVSILEDMIENDNADSVFAQTEAAAEEEENEASADPLTAEEESEDDSEDADTETAVDPTAPVNAYVTYDADQYCYVIVPDVAGQNVDFDGIADLALASIVQLEPSLDLDPEDCYEQAEILADDPDLLAALDEANQCLDLSLTYTFTPDGGDTSTVTLSREDLASFYYVDSACTLQVDEEMLGNYVASLVSEYSSSGKSTQFKTSGGSYIKIYVSQAGQSVDSTELYNDMYNCLSTKTGGTRTAPYETASDSGDGYWGGNYVEVDLTSQHLWCYKNGTCVVSCSCVSGCVADGTTTPTGCFTIFAKQTDRYLKGNNVDGSDYNSWVNYFMPFSGGCGIHDATWRSSFGGTIYYYNGSHGCVGVTLSNAKTIYNNVEVGTHVVVYGGISASSLGSFSQKLTVKAGSTSLSTGDKTNISVSGNRGKVTYKSSDESVLKVDSSGKVTAVGSGTATITATAAKVGNYAQGTGSVTIDVDKVEEPVEETPEVTDTHEHTWVAVNKTITVYVCKDCGQEFSTEAEAQAHEQTTTTTTFACSCGKTFSLNEDLQNHIAAEQQAAQEQTDSADETDTGTTTVTTHTDASVTTTSYSHTYSAQPKEVLDYYQCATCGETKAAD